MDTLSLLARESANEINPVGSLTPFGLPTIYICVAVMSFHVWLIKIKSKIIKANKGHDNVAIIRTIKHIILAFILFARLDVPLSSLLAAIWRRQSVFVPATMRMLTRFKS